MYSSVAIKCYTIRFVELNHRTINKYSNGRKKQLQVEAVLRTKTYSLFFAQCFVFTVVLNHENGKAKCLRNTAFAVL